MQRWNPEIYDPILKRLHSQGQFDGAMTDLMLNMGFAVSKTDVGNARRRLGLAANSPSGPPLQTPPPPKEKPNPLAEAKAWLGKRFEEKHIGDRIEYRLDGTPAKLVDIMRAFNRMRKAMGIEQITANETWRV